MRCVPRVSPLPAVNSDSDRVPDSVRVTFTDCVIGFRRGADTIRGSIDIIDPTPMGTDRSLKLAFIDFARIFVDRHDHSASITVNGSREAIRDSSQLSQTEVGFRTDYVFGNGATASSVRNWAIDFAADVPGSIVHDAGLPSGVLTITGIVDLHAQRHDEVRPAGDDSDPAALRRDVQRPSPLQHRYPGSRRDQARRDLDGDDPVHRVRAVHGHEVLTADLRAVLTCRHG